MKEISFFRNLDNRKKIRRKILDGFNFKKITSKEMNDYINFGKTYYDNSKIGIGYGKYQYDGRFEKNVKKIINFFKLKKKSKILEIGCAKGFLLVEFYKQGMDVIGLEKSPYAIKNSHKLIKKNIKNFDIEKKLNYQDQTFDFIICKEVFPHINPKKVNQVLKDINRIVKNKKNIYIFIQTFKSDNQIKLFKKWDVTHKSNYSKKKWKEIMRKNKFKGYVGFKTLF